MRFDLIDLRLFLAVVEHGSLTKGARVQHLSLASVSERIAGMESTLGTALLERNRRGVHPTPAGAALVRHARQILDQVDQMRGELRTYATGLKGRITFMANTAALAGALPRQLGDFLAAHPDLSIDLEERPSQDIVKALVEGRAHLGIVADFAEMGAVQTRPMYADQLVVLAHAGHPFLDGQAVAFADILDTAFVGLSDAALETHLAERASRLGRQLDYRIKLRSIEHVIDMVEAGIGLAVVSMASMASMQRYARDGVTASPLSDSWAARRLYLCARDFSALTGHAALLARTLRDAV